MHVVGVDPNLLAWEADLEALRVKYGVTGIFLLAFTRLEAQTDTPNTYAVAHGVGAIPNFVDLMGFMKQIAEVQEPNSNRAN